MKKTIKAMVREKLTQKGWGVSDDNVREIIKKILNKICELLPLPQGDSKISEDFIKVMFSGIGAGKVVDALTEMAMNERDDLAKHTSIRQELEKEIVKWR